MRDDRGSIGSVERILYLKRVPSFKNLPNEALAALAESAHERYFPRGSVVFEEDVKVAAIQHILDGRIRLSRGGQELNTAGPGTPLGALGLLARQPLLVRGVAEADTVTLEFEAESFLEVCEEHFSVLHGVMQHLARWIVDVERREGPQGPPPGECGPMPRLAEGDLDLVERIFYLRRFSVFAEVSINALAELSRGLTEVRFGPGVSLWRAGDPSPYALLVVQGEIDCVAPEGPRFRAGSGWGLGTMDALAEQPRWHDATTAGPVTALHGTIEGLVDVFEDNVEMAMSFLAVMARGMLSYLEKRGREAVPAPE